MTAPIDKLVAGDSTQPWDGVCWIIANPDGTEYEDERGYITPHFYTEAAARTFITDAGEDPVSQCAPRRLAAACVTVRCVECDYSHDEDDEGVTHWESREHAVKALTDWQFIGPHAWCQECKSPEAGEAAP